MHPTFRPEDHIAGPQPSPGARLRRLLERPAPGQLMGAHDGLSARIAQDAGFEAVWASGLCISTAMGVRDSNEASWTDLLNVVATMTDAVDVPVLVDGDTGHGDFNTARRFTARAERIGAAGVCFEDKQFPKMNSFVGNVHPLAPVGEFCGKIKACKDGQRDPEFVLVARTEALIAGRPMDEALERAAAYAEAGADALFIHSRKSTPVEIAEFMRHWKRPEPVVIAPTTYYTPSLREFGELDVAACIWANHSMRAAFAAMRDICREILAQGGIAKAEKQVAGLSEVFGLLDYKALENDEALYSGAPIGQLVP